MLANCLNSLKIFCRHSLTASTSHSCSKFFRLFPSFPAMLLLEEQIEGRGTREWERREQGSRPGHPGTRTNDPGPPPGMRNQRSFAVFLWQAVASLHCCANRMDFPCSDGQGRVSQLREETTGGDGAASGGLQRRCPPGSDHLFSHTL